LLEKDISDETKQLIAQEMNLSETAFVLLKEAGKTMTTSATFGLRWFTPKAEVPLCGHATLGTAAVLFNELDNTNVGQIFLLELNVIF